MTQYLGLYSLGFEPKKLAWFKSLIL